jgi:two-component system NtrC family response regulator
MGLAGNVRAGKPGEAGGHHGRRQLVCAADLDLAGREGTVRAQPRRREQADRKVIRHALARSEGNISSTAKLLGISRPTLYDLLKQYDLHA